MASFLQFLNRVPGFWERSEEGDMIKRWAALGIRFRFWLLRRAIRALEKRFAKAA